MNYFAVAVRDAKADGFAVPFFVPTLGMAERSFADEVNRGESPMNAHPDDYSLFHVGFFDSDAGLVTAMAVPHLVCSAVALLRPMN